MKSVFHILLELGILLSLKERSIELSEIAVACTALRLRRMQLRSGSLLSKKRSGVGSSRKQKTGPSQHAKGLQSDAKKIRLLGFESTFVGPGNAIGTHAALR